MLVPKKVKHRKWQTKRVNANKKVTETRGITLAFGSHGIRAISGHRVQSNQIESARKCGSVFSQIVLLLKKQLKCLWEREKVILQDTVLK